MRLESFFWLKIALVFWYAATQQLETYLSRDSLNLLSVLLHRVFPLKMPPTHRFNISSASTLNWQPFFMLPVTQIGAPRNLLKFALYPRDQLEEFNYWSGSAGWKVER
jgi:hypothetical protein